MKVKSIRSNQTEIVKNNGSRLLVSYETPVAYWCAPENRLYITDKKWSVTTSKHINKWKQQFSATEKRVDQAALDNYMSRMD
jgi:hypothetical protein